MRIQNKFSRYNPASIIGAINRHPDKTTPIDQETSQLFTLATELYQLTDGMFDITAGVLNTIWQFKKKSGPHASGSHASAAPTQAEVDKTVALVGWDKVTHKVAHDTTSPSATITMRPGMQLDLGGIGKEYAVDRAARIIKQHEEVPVLINFGGDIIATGPPINPDSGAPSHWQVAIHDPTQKNDGATGAPAQAPVQIALENGAVATSGDSFASLTIQNKRYSHIINPKTGYPIVSRYRSITVLAATCIAAGALATTAYLKQEAGEAFLTAQGLPYYLLGADGISASSGLSATGETV